MPDLVVAVGGEEPGSARQLAQLHGRDRATARRLGPRVRGADNLARPRHGRHAQELDPLDVPDDGNSHPRSLTSRHRRPFQRMMGGMTVPPFERFYEDNKGIVLGMLSKRLGRDRAEDAFQETFFRALRAYPKLRDGSNLRAWALTIAANVATDEHRRRTLWSGTEVPDIESVDEQAGYAELREMTAELPPTERAAVVLRYGYDLDYQRIGAVLGSSAEAARQAASSGVRRLRRKELS
jgi:RNA polymerase sigma factor (sigma-70 family)